MEILSILFDIFSNLTESAAVMLSGLFSIWLSGRETKFFGVRIRSFLQIFGSSIFVFGFILTLIIFFLQTYKEYIEQIEIFKGFIFETYPKILAIVSDPFLWLYLFMSIFSLPIFVKVRRYWIVKGYDISFNETTEVSGVKQRAIIQIENVGKGKVSCVAQLAKISKKKTLAGKEELLLVKYINPRAFPFTWNKGVAQVDLEKEFPKILNIVEGDFSIISGNAKFVFTDSKSIFYSENLDKGYYRISIDLFRLENGKKHKLASFEKELQVGESGLFWVGGDNPVKKDVKIKTQKKKAIKDLRNLIDN